MQDFFKKVFYTGFKILIGILIFIIIYFIIGYFNPSIFNSKKQENANLNNNQSTSTINNKQNQSLGYSIYNSLFKGNSSSTTKKTTKKVSSFTSKTKTIFDNYIIDIPNKDNSPVLNMSINSVSVDYFGNNNLNNGDYISGYILGDFQNQYFFYIDIYNKDERLLFSIPAYSSLDLNNKDYYNFYSNYKSIWNYNNYQGPGYMVIRSNNNQERKIVVLKININ